MASRCSFCTKPEDQVETLVAGAGVFICNECVELSALVIAEKKTRGPAPRVPFWDQMEDQAILDHLPRVEAVRDQVDDDLRAWVAEARRRGLSWDRVGGALGMKRQSAWERFSWTAGGLPGFLRIAGTGAARIRESRAPMGETRLVA
ncbi:ClpX C4-type zinc finger protein [Actinoplanes couchii]|uniref:ClpX-type ZB domain-containing protein n=1 Tax=Actinoplanes couchii TaxID=403638 RepID=A0ABQ3XG06_9ACTN|nr:ClpX C4-type zinc finger protein [Actinoplanes couchii]MDR6320920.1 hypothetical protein [Actinoplanes couchii]GID57432.1 hypothetical protein Aco03nite_058360 [Actinoplanes couchii]